MRWRIRSNTFEAAGFYRDASGTRLVPFTGVNARPDYVQPWALDPERSIKVLALVTNGAGAVSWTSTAPTAG